MELIVDRAVMLSELSLLQGVVEKKNTLPVLAHLLMRAEAAEGSKGAGGRVELAATDLEIGIVSEFQAQCLSGGGLTVSAKKMHEIVRSLPDADLHLKSKDGRCLEISCGRAQYSIMGLPEGDFPSIPAAPSVWASSVPCEALVKLVSETSFAITADETRFAVSGGLLLLSRMQATLVATDGHRLAYASAALPGSGPESPVQILLPRKTLVELRKLADSGDETIGFHRDDKHVFFRAGSRTMISRVLEGTFPSYEKVIPLTHPRVFTLGRDELLAAVRRVAILSNDRTRAIRIAFMADRIELRAESPELGEAREHIPYEYSGPEMQVAFNATYIMDFLGAVATDKIEVRLKDPETQALFLPSQKTGQKVEETDYRYVIMPMRA